MTVYDVAARLPAIEVVRQRCKALTVLDAIVEGDYYTYEPAWGAGEAAAMRNGSGEEYDIVFTEHGVFIRGLYHESPMIQIAEGRLWPGLLDGLPEEFRPQVDEPAFSWDGRLNATFVLWRRTGDDRWHAGDGIDLSPADVDEEDPDGSWLLDVLFDDIAEQYAQYADEVLEIELPPAAIEHVVAFRPLTGEAIRALNPDADLAHVRSEAARIGYPLA
ncbi:hypothetical protein BJY16_005334 [Actinoplanes octamycinicus]|uniref:Uncharacterized protein n=1 Tax=Actinoplanes octamycinicus TaxID=135948 RepID=A0A7W7H0S5_9ACTN|nr:hypothetical protein [Actinoplanes octamycinicus]